MSNALIPELAVSNWCKSLAFYVDILGFDVDYMREDEGFAMLKIGDAQLMIDQIGEGRTFDDGLSPDNHPFGRGLNLQIEVTSLDAMLGALKSAQIELYLPLEEKWYRTEDEEAGNRQFIVADPDGYLLRFFEDMGRRAIAGKDD